MPIRYPARPLVSVLLMILFLTSCSPAQPAPGLLIGNIRTHDPAMIREDKTYYVSAPVASRFISTGVRIGWYITRITRD